MFQNKKGFTLLEILIALFIFTLLSLMLVAGLRTVINANNGSERSAERLRKLQMALLVMSRDVEQAINRPIINSSGQEERAFVGTPQSFVFTHAGMANPNGALLMTTMQRTRYEWHDNTLYRVTWPTLDQAPETKVHSRILLNGVSELRFQYLDKKGHFQHNWPGEGESKNALPRAVRITMTISDWGKISQLYVISAEASSLTPSIQKP